MGRAYSAIAGNVPSNYIDWATHLVETIGFYYMIEVKQRCARLVFGLGDTKPAIAFDTIIYGFFNKACGPINFI
jgi:hypothetical protein